MLQIAPIRMLIGKDRCAFNNRLDVFDRFDRKVAKRVVVIIRVQHPDNAAILVVDELLRHQDPQKKRGRSKATPS